MPAPRYNVNVTMPEERMFQLRELSEQLGNVSMSETMNALFAAARAQGLIKGHSIPGVTINALSDGIVIQFDDGAHVPFSFEGAIALANTVKQFVAGSNTESLITDEGHDFSVQRKGRGIIVTITPKSSKAWNADLAAEFADLMEAAAGQK
jgi:hypothetical protein